MNLKLIQNIMLSTIYQIYIFISLYMQMSASYIHRDFLHVHISSW